MRPSLRICQLFTITTILVFILPCYAAIAFVNVVNGACNGASTTCAAAAGNHTAGNMLAVSIVNNSVSIQTSSIADTAGNSYSICTGSLVQGGPGSSEIWFAKNIIGNASNVVTVTFSSASAAFKRVEVLQYSGADTVNPCETAGVSSSTCTTASFSPAASGNVNVAVLHSDTGVTWTAGTNYTLEDSVGTDTGSEDRLNAPAGSQTATATNAGHACAISAASFKPAAAAAGGGSVKKKKVIFF